jgi:ABC-type uncharacterized transport system fused permease/ATPase subunit
MENAFAKAEELAGNIKDYIDTRIDGIKLSAAEKTSALVANIAAGSIAIFVFLLFIIFGGIALSFGLGEWIGRTWAGFLIVAFAYLLFGVIIWKLRRKIIQLPVMNALIEQLFKTDDEEN